MSDIQALMQQMSPNNPSPMAQAMERFRAATMPDRGRQMLRDRVLGVRTNHPSAMREQIRNPANLPGEDPGAPMYPSGQMKGTGGLGKPNQGRQMLVNRATALHPPEAVDYHSPLEQAGDFPVTPPELQPRIPVDADEVQAPNLPPVSPGSPGMSDEDMLQSLMQQRAKPRAR